MPMKMKTRRLRASYPNLFRKLFNEELAPTPYTRPLPLSLCPSVPPSITHTLTRPKINEASYNSE